MQRGVLARVTSNSCGGRATLHAVMHVQPGVQLLLMQDKSIVSSVKATVALSILRARMIRYQVRSPFGTEPLNERSGGAQCNDAGQVHRQLEPLQSEFAVIILATELEQRKLGVCRSSAVAKPGRN